jgi:hypothetical protein
MTYRNHDIEPGSGEYQVVEADSTDALEKEVGSGKAGDYLKRIVIIPTGAHGSVSIVDGATSIEVSQAGSSERPQVLDLGIFSLNGAWSIATGANIRVLAVGKFS